MIEKIKKICKDNNIFISFRDSVNVSLINPKNIYGTPTGVYSYPSNDFLNQIEKCNTIEDFLEIFPFKGKNKPSFIYLYFLDKKSVIFDNNSTFDEIKPYYEKIIKLYENSNDYFKKMINNVQKYIDNEIEKDDWYGGLKTFDIFKIYDIRKSDSKSEIHKLWELTYNIADDDSTKWGNLFRRIGIDVLIDHGDGYIHGNEPTQAILFNQRMIYNHEIINIDDITFYRNDIKEKLKSGEGIDFDQLSKVYYKDPGFVFNVLLYKIKSGDYHFIDNCIEFIIMNKDNKIVNNILQIYLDNIENIEVNKLDNKLIKLFIDKFGDIFYKKYIDIYLKNEPYFVIDEVDLNNKLIVGSLLYANKLKTIDFFKRNKQYNFKKELEFLYDDPKLIKKYRNMHSFYFNDVTNMWHFMKDDDIIEKNKEDELEHRYELFKKSYEKSTGFAWSYEKFKQRSQNWDFYGDYNGYIAVRHQSSGYYKLVGSAGDFKSVIRGLNDLLKENKPVWGVMTKELSELLIKRYGFYQPPKRLFKYIFKLINLKNDNIKIENDGGLIIDYNDIGKTKKYFIANKKYYIDLLNHDFFEKNKILQKILKFFINKI